MAECNNIFFRCKIIYSTRNENLHLYAALTCAQHVIHMSEKLFNSESTQNTLQDETGRLN